MKEAGRSLLALTVYPHCAGTFKYVSSCISQLRNGKYNPSVYHLEAV